MSEHELLQAIRREIGEVKERVNELYDLMFKGDPSLVTRVALHETRISAIEESRESSRPNLAVSTGSSGLRAMVIAVVTAIAGVAGYFATKAN